MSIQLDLDNVYLKITGMEKEDEVKLWDILCFQIQIYGMQEVRYRHLYNRKTKKTYAGLLDYVIEFLQNNDLEYVLNDNRVKPESNADFKLVEFIDNEKTIPLKLRPYQQEIVDNCREREVIQAATGAGKAMPLNTEILTPKGFVPLRDIHVGDVIYDENGKKTIVTGEYPQDELKQEYRITFDDGSETICCKDHMWKYKVVSSKNKEWRENTLEIMMKQSLKSGRRFRLAIPVCKPVEFEKQELFLHPYLLGALLGDGGLSQPTITFTNVEQDVIDKVNNYVGEFGTFKHRADENHISLYFVGGKNNSFVKYIRETFGFIKSADKFIPKEYKMSSIEDRIEILRGLFDTDGSVTEKGQIRFETTSRRLIEDVQFILRSLGYRAKIRHSIRDKCETWNINVRGRDDILISSKKHLEKFANRKIAKKQHHYEVMKIISIEPLTTKVQMKCLTVDSPFHTFICNDFIVTHNTLMMAATIAKFNVKPVCIFADKIGLCMQLKQEIEKFLGVEVGIVGDGLKEYKDITVISLQSAEQEYIENAQMILFDECHHVPSATCTDVANKCVQAYYRVGVSATPWRDAGDEMLIEACLAKRHNETNINASKLIELGYLVKPDICFVPIKQVFKGKNYNDIYNQAIVNNDYRNRIIYKITEQMYIRNKHILILFKTIKHGEEMQKQLLDRLGEEVTPIRVINPKNGKETTVRVRNVEMLSGNDDALRRTAVFEAVKQGICRCLIASTIADEGLDLPILDTLILAGGGKSSTRAFQRVGRVLRLAEGKEKAIVFDFIDYTPMLRRHSRTRQKYYETEPLWDIRKFVVNPDT